MERSIEHFHCRLCLLTEAQGKRSKGTASIFSLCAILGHDHNKHRTTELLS